MIYPDSFEHKIGFTEIRTLLKGRCLSTLGTEWIDHKLAFLTDHAEIIEALEQAREFILLLDTEEDVYEDDFYDVRQPLLRIRPERTYMEELELFDLKRSLQTVVSIVSFLKNSHNDDEEGTPKYPALARMASGVDVFPEIVRRIDEVLNKYGKVKDTASPELLTIRHSIEVTTRGISHSLRAIITQAQTDGYIDRDVNPTLRDGRLVIPVAPALKRKIKGIIHDESASGKTVFIEPATVVDANNRIRELKAAEKREIIRILQELSALVRPHVSEMLSSLHFLAHVDYLRALAGFSRSFESVVPEVKNYPCINWHNAVHPLLEQSLRRHGGKIVPLDICLQQHQKILLISGPNAGGKSVCLKTVGLLQYMLQCGMPVPLSEDSVCGTFSGICIDIGDEQSIEDELSTYSSHLLAMKRMMKDSNPATLLLIDEFGGGTEPQIGGALAEAILDRFVKTGTFGIITTHYQNLKQYAEKSHSVVNGAMLYDRAKMQPLFMLQIGNPGSSFAVEIARKIGIPEEVIEYATHLVGKDYVMSDKYLQDIVRDKMYWENKRAGIRKKEKQLEETAQRYEEEFRDLQHKKSSVIAQAKEQAQHLISESNARIENTIRAIREAQAEKEQTREVRQQLVEFKNSVEGMLEDADDPITRKMLKISRRQERRQQNKERKANATARPANHAPADAAKVVATEQKQPQTFRVGDTVRLKGQTTVGRIDKLSGPVANVLFGMMNSRVTIDRLEHAELPKDDLMKREATFVSKATRDAIYEKKLHFKPDIDLRGMRGEEALTAVAYFIDDAIQLEQSRVRILHGTGTGALRQLVREYLASTPGVRTFRDEHVQFGGAGITVVELS